MINKGAVIVMYDAPPEADDWMHGPHYDEVRSTPGVSEVRRYEILAGPDGCRRYVAIIESVDLESTLAWRGGPEGQRSQSEADSRGVSNRFTMIGKRIF